MSTLSRVGAIVRADFLIRFRRLSTLVVFLLLSSLSYMWIPAPSTGRALLMIGGKRAVLNSAAIGMATAALASIFIGLIGFYVISNAIRTDVQSRCGYVIAATTMRRHEYILGKFAGNLVFLTVFTSGFMLSSMAMVLVRGEGPLQPFVFAQQYLLLLPPSLVMVSAIAILFEATPLLRGKLGDVGYFFLWIGSLGLVPASTANGGNPGFLRLFDYTGLAFLTEALRMGQGTNDVSIGASTFDPKKPALVFEGLDANVDTFLWRLGATLLPMLLLVAASMLFHRFDPSRVKASEAKDGGRWLGRINMLFKPIPRGVFALVIRPGAASPLRAAAADAMLTFTTMPIALVAAIGFAVASLAAADGGRSLLPALFVAYAIAVAEIACREPRAGMSALVMSVPHTREMRVLWKFGVALLVGIVFFAVPAMRIAMANPGAALVLGVGIVFVAALATMLGITTSNPKTFLALFLVFWYVVMNDRGNSKLDFAGFHSTPALSVTATYGAIAIACIVAAHVFHTVQLRRRW